MRTHLFPAYIRRLNSGGYSFDFPDLPGCAPVEGRPDMVGDEIRNRSVKKTLTIPYWLNEAAERNHVNFSQVLQEALKERVGA